MYRLANFDISRPIASRPLRLAAQFGFGLACAASMVLLRLAVDVVAPTAGPFSLVYPTVLIATLYGHWQAGAVAFVATFFWAWYVVLPPTGSLLFEVDTDPSRVVLNAASALIVIAFAETFRRAVRKAMAERNAEIERRKLFHAEIEHRTRNNFALVASLLGMQRRQQSDAAVSEALDGAIDRVNSFAQAYANLSTGQGDGSTVAMKPYLTEIVTRIRQAAFGANATVTLDCDACELPRETAAAIGLFVNEALTNSAKHAFPNARAGTVHVRFVSEDDGWKLSVSDDGVGAGEARSSGTGLGTRLFDAFAQQAGASHTVEHSDRGRTVSLASA